MAASILVACALCVKFIYLEEIGLHATKCLSFNNQHYGEDLYKKILTLTMNRIFMRVSKTQKHPAGMLEEG